MMLHLFRFYLYTDNYFKKKCKNSYSSALTETKKMKTSWKCIFPHYRISQGRDDGQIDTQNCPPVFIIKNQEILFPNLAGEKYSAF